MQKIWYMLVLLGLAGCVGSDNKIIPGIVPNSAKEKQVIKVMPNNIIGEVEPIYLLPMKSPFMSRIDTGAATSSLDTQDIKHFERDGQKWVSFTVINRETGEKHTFEKSVVRTTRIKRVDYRENRPKVVMEVKMAGEVFKADFTLADRRDFDYQTLVGRNILNGRAIVDVSLQHTLK